MFINEVENVVGLSKKSIRYYEEVGLIRPNRNQENDYRIYSEEDINKLKLIKFLRELNVPIKELKYLDDGKITLQDCLEDRIKKVEIEEEKYQRIKLMCKEIIDLNLEYNSIDITKYFQEIRKLNKECFTMHDDKSLKNNKKVGAIVSSIIFCLMFLFLGCMILYFQLTDEETIPWILFVILEFILFIPIIGIIYNLIVRIKEINGGEEDEASKY